MNPVSLLEYASSEGLTEDEIYTIELLIERVRSESDPGYWDEWSERSDAREVPGYKPHFQQDLLQPASGALMALTWMSFQRLRRAARPIRDITALRFLPKLAGLVLTDNEVVDIRSLQDCTELRRLILQRNPIRDISPLGRCQKLEQLECFDTPIEDFSVLQELPYLRTFSFSTAQVPAFRRIKCLPALQVLELDLDTFDSFEGFPLMPELRVIRGAHVTNLRGLERFPKLENLVNLSGEFSSLEPLRELKQLTHMNASCRVRSLEPLASLFALRDLWLDTQETDLDLSPLGGLPALHEVTIRCAGREPSTLERLRSELSSWDVEFASAQRRYTPSLELQIVDQGTFDRYDIHELFGVDDRDGNQGLLDSERGWLERNLEEVLLTDFTKDEDFIIPFQWGGGRSRTVVLLSERAIEAFPRLVLAMQDVLARADRDWIIYLQSEENDFVVWVYPDKILVTEEFVAIVRKLVGTF
jgi:hypothetical protein